MEQQELKRNLKLGAFVVAGILLFLVAIYYVGKENNTIFNKTFTVSAVFKNVEGLQPGDNVWLSGVKIGTVKDVRIISNGKVIVTLSLKENQNAFVKRNSTASIGSDGLVGNKIVVIRPGTDGQIIHDNDTINADSPTDTQELFNLAKDIGGNTRLLTAELQKMMEKINKGEGVIGGLMNDGELTKEIQQLIVSLRQAGQNTNVATGDLKNLVHEIANGDGLLTHLVKDTSYARTFNSALQNVAKVGENSKAISQELKELTAKINSHDNALGVLLADSTFAHKLRATLDNAQAASYKLDQNMEAMQHNFLLRGYFKKQRKDEEKLKKQPAPTPKSGVLGK